MLCNDIAVKTRAKGDHLIDFKKVYNLVRLHQLRMNKSKSFLGISSGIFLRFIVTSNGILLDPEKTRAIQEMQPSRNLRKLMGSQGKLAYIHRFISNHSRQCQPFIKLMKKGVSFIWVQGCQDAFEEIKCCLMSPPVLAAPIS